MLIDVKVKTISKTFLLTNHIPVIRDLGANQWTEAEILSFAAGVESNTNHPLGKAIMDAAGSANCIVMKVVIAEVHNKCELR
jgi:cation transport ATPase